MFNKLGIINKDQRGFTLVELMIAIAISALIIGGLTLTIFQLFGGHARSSSEMTVIRQVQNAGYHISHDAQMAQIVNTDDDPETTEIIELVTLTWTKYLVWTPEEVITEEHQVVYAINDGALKREHYIKAEGAEDFVLDATTFVAEYISSISCYYAGDKLPVTVTASVVGFKPQSETRIYEAKPRPNVY